MAAPRMYIHFQTTDGNIEAALAEQFENGSVTKFLEKKSFEEKDNPNLINYFLFAVRTKNTLLPRLFHSLFTSLTTGQKDIKGFNPIAKSVLSALMTIDEINSLEPLIKDLSIIHKLHVKNLTFNNFKQILGFKNPVESDNTSQRMRSASTPAKPVVAKSVVAELVSAELVSTKPVAAKPFVAELVSAKSIAAKPASIATAKSATFSTHLNKEKLKKEPENKSTKPFVKKK